MKKIDSNAAAKADAIYVGGTIYTVDDRTPWATAMVVKDGKFLYVGDDKGAAAFDGPVVDLKGKFVMPGIVDSHAHIGWGTEAVATVFQFILTGENKAEVLKNMKAFIAENQDVESYKFYLAVGDLGGERLTRDELDALCPDKPLLIVEIEQHSRWMNTLEMRAEQIDDYMPDISPGLSYCERDEDGRINGRMYEFCGMAARYATFSEEFYASGMDWLMENWKKWGVVAVFDAGQASSDASIATFFQTVKAKGEKGDLPLYVEGCYFLYNPAQLDTAIEELKAYTALYHTDLLQVRTMKIMMDGTANGLTAAMSEPYVGSDSRGATLLDAETLKKFLLDLNREGIDLHVHTVGDRAIATVLDAVEKAKAVTDDKWQIQVTCAHAEIIREEDFARLAKLGILVNFTPCWFGGCCYASYDAMVDLLGEARAARTHQANTVWNAGVLTAFSSDCVNIAGINSWNPYVGIETGITRQNHTNPLISEEDYSVYPACPSEADRLNLAQMIRGYTLNGAIQMRLEDKIGSIEAGKDASFLVFEKNLFDLDVYALHNQLPEAFYIRGKKIND